VEATGLYPPLCKIILGYFDDTHQRSVKACEPTGLFERDVAPGNKRSVCFVIDRTRVTNDFILEDKNE